MNTATGDFDKHVLKRTGADCRIRVSRACKRGIFSRFFLLHFGDIHEEFFDKLVLKAVSELDLGCNQCSLALWIGMPQIMTFLARSRKLWLRRQPGAFLFKRFLSTRPSSQPSFALFSHRMNSSQCSKTSELQFASKFSRL